MTPGPRRLQRHRALEPRRALSAADACPHRSRVAHRPHLDAAVLRPGEGLRDAQRFAILLLDQDRGRWDRVLIGRGLAALERAAALGREPGPYQLQAAIAACHARARTADATDWPQIVALYDALAQRVPSPVVELNRAVAVGMAFGPAAALPLVDALAGEPALQRYPLLHSVRADLLAKLQRKDEARAALERAAGMTSNQRERELLRERMRSLMAAR